MDGAGSNIAYKTISVVPASPTVGAEIGNVDLTKPLTDIQLAEVKRAFTEYCVLFFRDQNISFEDHTRLAEYFGPIGTHVGKQTNSKITEDPRVRKFHFDENSEKISGRSDFSKAMSGVPSSSVILVATENNHMCDEVSQQVDFINSW